MQNTEKANWDKWRHMPEVVLWEAVALSLDIEPDYLQARNNKINRHKQAIQYDDEPKFNDRFKIAERNHGREKNKALQLLSIIPGTGREGISLAKFAAWAQSINWEIPQELANLSALGSDEAVGDGNGNDEGNGLTTAEEPKKVITRSANEKRTKNKQDRINCLKNLVDEIYSTGESKGLNWAIKDTNGSRKPLPYSRRELYDYFFEQYPDIKKISFETFISDNEIPPIVKFSTGNKSKKKNRLQKLLNPNGG